MRQPPASPNPVSNFRFSKKNDFFLSCLLTLTVMLGIIIFKSIKISYEIDLTGDFNRLK